MQCPNVSKLSTASILAVLIVVLTACRPTPTPPPPTSTPVPPTQTPIPSEPTAEATPATESTVVDIVANSADLTRLAGALEEAGLVDKLASDGPYTLFAPTNTAFDAVEAELLDDPDLLFDILLYHVAEATLLADDAAEEIAITSLLGDELKWAAKDDSASVNGATIVEADIKAENGVVHIIDNVLLPPTLGTD